MLTQRKENSDEEYLFVNILVTVNHLMNQKINK